MNNKFVQGFGISLAYLVLGALGYFVPAFNLVFSVIALLLFVYLVRKDWIYSLYFLLTDIVISPHGRLFGADALPLSVREVIFISTITLILTQIDYRKVKSKLNNIYPWWVAGLLVSIGFAFLLGVSANGFGAAFDDANSYFYLILLILLPLVSIKSGKLKEVFNYFLGTLIGLSVVTIFLSVFFSHAPGLVTDPWYSFFRDMRIAEITLLVASVQNMPGLFGSVIRPFLGEASFLYRVFIPSQIFLFIPSVYYVLEYLRQNKIFTKELAFGFLSISALLLSLSRSYLLAFCVSIVAVLIMSKAFRKQFLDIINLKNAAKLSCTALLSVAVAISSAAIFPELKPNLEQATFFGTSAEQGREVAVSSRWNLLDELHSGILSSVPFGAGMGSALVYDSEDPRITQTGSSAYETYRFEWGYHDIVYKTGVLGLLSLLALVYWLYILIKDTGLDSTTLAVNFIVPVMLIVNIFSPYLNHPLGAICILFAVLWSLEGEVGDSV